MADKQQTIMAPPEPADDEAEVEGEGAGSRKMDPELRAMAGVLRILDSLGTEAAKSRVVSWVHNRFFDQDDDP
jgi:hypothetical protein